MTHLNKNLTLKREVHLTSTRVAVSSVASSRTGDLAPDLSLVSCDTTGAGAGRLLPAGRGWLRLAGAEPLLVLRGPISALGDPAVSGCSCLRLLVSCVALTLVTVGADSGRVLGSLPCTSHTFDRLQAVESILQCTWVARALSPAC